MVGDSMDLDRNMQLLVSEWILSLTAEQGQDQDRGRLAGIEKYGETQKHSVDSTVCTVPTPCCRDQ